MTEFFTIRDHQTLTQAQINELKRAVQYKVAPCFDCPELSDRLLRSLELTILPLKDVGR